MKVCYEAGPTGFDLARKLIDQDIGCLVVRPGRLDEYGRKVNNDQTDALALADRFDRHLQGNQRALVEVRQPALSEELRRAQGRQRQQFVKLRGSLAAMGRSLCLLHGVRALGHWWLAARWKELRPQLSAELIEMLERSRQTLLHLDEQVRVLDQQLKQRGAQCRPRGLGAMTLELIQGEVCCWDRFTNRKQPGSYAGLTGGVSATGSRHADLSITKAGNRRLRTYLIEACWRLVTHQPDCRLVRRFKHMLGEGTKAHRAKRKKAIVAMARVLITDLWRWQTGRRTLAQLGYETID